MKKIVSIVLLLLVQVYPFVSIYIGASEKDADSSISKHAQISKHINSNNIWIDVFENENEDETELDYHVLQVPKILLLNFDTINSLLESFKFSKSLKFLSCLKCPVFITNRQILI
jgi:hypothetical protein